MIFAGTPTTVQLLGMFLLTTESAPIITLSPTIILPIITASALYNNGFQLCLIHRFCRHSQQLQTDECYKILLFF